MSETLEFLVRHGYLLLFLFVLAEQVGLPIPSVPMLLAAGALSGLGRMSLAASWLLAVFACQIGDFLWFSLGRWRGASILNLLCRISLEPDTCVQKTQTTYGRHGANWLLFAKFLPGLSTIAPPMAGLFKVNIFRFAAMDTSGAFLWSGVYLAVGWIFRDQLEWVADLLGRLGSGLGIVLIGSLLLYIGFKYMQRQRVYRELRIARITPQELKVHMDNGDRISVIDLRGEYEWREGRIPGSHLVDYDEVDTFVPDSTQGEIVLYCSCPNEASSARAALRLKRQGVKKVRPLEGGFPLWKDLGFPVEFPAAEETAAAPNTAEPVKQ